jgi:tetratricopeptide (TPR) repeat protein
VKLRFIASVICSTFIFTLPVSSLEPIKPPQNNKNAHSRTYQQNPYMPKLGPQTNLKDPDFKPNERNFKPNEPKFKPNERSFKPNEPKFKPNNGHGDPKEPNFNPSEPNYRNSNKEKDSVFKEVYNKFVKQWKPQNNINSKKINSEETGQFKKSPEAVFKSIYKLESNVSSLRSVRQHVYMPKVDLKKSEITDVLEKIKTYLDVRDMKYAKMMQIITAIEVVQDDASKKKLVLEFENIFKTQRKIDEQGHNRIDNSLKFIYKNFRQTSPEEQEKIKVELQQILEKYKQHKIAIKFFVNKLKELKYAAIKDILQSLLEKAEKLKQSGNLADATKYYENALSMNQENPELIKSLGKALKETEGTGPKVYVKGKKPDFDVKPTIVNGRTMVPLRAIANSLGITNENIKFDSSTKTITLIKDDNEVKLTIGKPSITINGTEKPIDVPAMIIDGRTLVPARVVSEALDANVNYDQDTQMITIEDNFTTNTSNNVDEEIKELEKEYSDDISNEKISQGDLMNKYLNTDN